MNTQSNIRQISSSRLPTRFGDFMIQVFQDSDTHIEHVALTMGDINHQQDVLVRVHSECLTGDIFASARCDCGEQLQRSQELIAQEGKGAIIYLRDHEGRGIGLSNKIHAYALQDKGLDTVEANVALGLPVDTRTFNGAAAMIQALGIVSIRLLSNNPHKMQALQSNGIIVSKLEPLKIHPNRENQKYLATKHHKLGHFL